MKKRTMKIGMLVLGTFLALSLTAHADIRKDFVVFDQAFIPPLALTNQGKVKPSRKAMKRLVQNWETFKAEYYESNPGDSKWKEDFDRIDHVISGAKKIVKSGENLMSAHEELEEIRIITLELRKRNNIDYFLDPLTEFHSLMEEIFHFGAENVPGDLDEAMIRDLNETVSEAVTLWQEIGRLPFDKDLYGFTDQKVAEMNEYIKREAGALGKVSKAIKSNDRASILKAAKGVKPNYAKLYKMFGDFESLKK